MAVIVTLVDDATLPTVMRKRADPWRSRMIVYAGTEAAAGLLDVRWMIVSPCETLGPPDTS